MLVGRLVPESVGASMTTVLTKTFPQEVPTALKAVPAKKRVLIVGGGFAGIAAARALKRADVEITLIDRRNHHIFQPLLYQVATAVLAPSEIAAPIRQLCRQACHEQRHGISDHVAMTYRLILPHMLFERLIPFPA